MKGKIHSERVMVKSVKEMERGVKVEGISRILRDVIEKDLEPE